MCTTVFESLCEDQDVWATSAKQAGTCSGCLYQNCLGAALKSSPPTNSSKQPTYVFFLDSGVKINYMQDVIKVVDRVKTMFYNPITGHCLQHSLPIRVCQQRRKSVKICK